MRLLETEDGEWINLDRVDYFRTRETAEGQNYLYAEMSGDKEIFVCRYSEKHKVINALNSLGDFRFAQLK